MKTAIPQQFRLAGKTWHVRELSDKDIERHPDGGEDVFGLCLNGHSEILIRAGLPQQEREHTFLHELVHAMLYTLGWGRLNADEDRVDALAGMLHQFLQTKRGRL